mgnify:CR=1 FL=1|jgi:hypothetical protein
MLTLEVTKIGSSTFTRRDGRWSDLIETAKQEPEYWPSERASQTANHKKFTGTNTFEEAIKLAEDGWPEGRAKFADMAGVASYQIGHRRPGTGYDVGGRYPNVPRFCAGDPASMVTSDPRNDTQRHIVTIYVACCASWSVSTDTILHRGAAIGGLIDAVEDEGHSVRLVVFENNKAYQFPAWYEIEVKSAGEPLDLDLMAFAVTHPAVLRRLVFSVHEQNGHIGEGGFHDTYIHGYGSVGNGWPTKRVGERPHGALFFDSLIGNPGHFASIEAAAKFVASEWETRIAEDASLQDAA